MVANHADAVSPPSVGFAPAPGRTLAGMPAPLAIQPRTGTRRSADSSSGGTPEAAALLAVVLSQVRICSAKNCRGGKSARLQPAVPSAGNPLRRADRGFVCAHGWRRTQRTGDRREPDPSAARLRPAVSPPSSETTANRLGAAARW